MKFLPKQKQTLFYIMLSIQLGRRPKQMSHKDIDPPEGGWVWCKCQSLPGWYGRAHLSSSSVLGLEKSSGLWLTGDNPCVGKNCRQVHEASWAVSEKWEDAFNWLVWAFALGTSNRVETENVHCIPLILWSPTGIKMEASTSNLAICVA